MVAPVERRADVGMSGDASAARDESGRAQSSDRYLVSGAHLGRHRRRSLENGLAVRVVPVACLLAGIARQFDADRVRVAATRVPCDVLLAHTLDRRIRIDAVVGRDLGDRACEPGSARLRGTVSFADLHRVDHDERDRAALHTRLVRALDEVVRHTPSRDRRRSQVQHSATRPRVEVDASIRELAENPNVHQPLAAGRELVTDWAGRFVIYLAAGTSVHSATVQRVRLGAEEVSGAVAEIRAILRDHGRAGAEWELGESCTPSDLVSRLAALGIVPDENEPVAIGMVLEAGTGLSPPPGVSARPVATIDELVIARRIQSEAFGGSADVVELAQAETDFAAEGVIGSTFLAFVEDMPVAAAYASYTPIGILLFGGATLPSARGRGVYRALVAARASEAVDRGTPVLVTHAGQMSRPILERLGFRPVARIDRLLDVF